MIRFMTISAGILLASSAFADILPPGASGPPDILNTGGILEATTSGIITASTGNSSDPGFVANVTEWVYSDPFNRFGSGDLDFIIQVTNTGPGINERVTSGGFAGFQTDLGVDTSAGIGVSGGVAPITVDRSMNGNVVGFNFVAPGSPIDAGQNTTLLEIATDAQYFTTGTISVQDGTSGFTNGFVPSSSAGSSVPEPGTLALVGGGMMAVAFLRRRAAANSKKNPQIG